MRPLRQLQQAVIAMEADEGRDRKGQDFAGGADQIALAIGNRWSSRNAAPYPSAAR